ncbi:MAG: RcnB family protein [Magnetospirillum sp.]|nr:RcnB family protein [Magnetospirillum sp.]
MTKYALAVLMLLAAAGPALADPGGRHGGEQRSEREADLGDIIISAAERALIQQYYQDHPVMVADLPPGIRKKVARGKPLPPGIAKRFPGDLRAQLPARPGYEYRVVGADVLLVQIATGVIVDLVRDILR